MTNEKRLIDADDVRHKLHEYTRGYERGILDAQKIVCGQDTVDAVGLVNGRWIRVFDDSAGWVDMCNKCKEFGDGTPYCPNCGAKMDK